MPDYSVDLHSVTDLSRNLEMEKLKTASQKHPEGCFSGSVPILIITCNRFEHFRNLVTSLQQCHRANNTHLYIALDGPFSDAVKSDNEKILCFAKDIAGFEKVTLFKREKNLGPRKNMAEAVESIFRENDRFILLEDDLVVARNFLLFMNQAMDAFGKDPNCFSVSGYHFEATANSAPAVDFYQLPYFSAWGVGFFRDRFVYPYSNLGKRASGYFLNPINYMKSNQIDRRLFPQHLNCRIQGVIHGDIFYRLHCLINNLYTVFPSSTKVINRGFDGTGINCGALINPFHQFFENEQQDKFCFSPNKEADTYYQRQNCKWFSRQWPDLAKHSLSLYWKYFVRAVGLRKCPPPLI